GGLQTGPRGGTQTIASAPALTTTVPVGVTKLPPLDLGPEPMTPDTLGAAVTDEMNFTWASVGDGFASGDGDPLHAINDPSDPANFDGVVWGTKLAFVPVATPLSGGVAIPIDAAGTEAQACKRSDRAPATQVNGRLRSLYPELEMKFGSIACENAATTDLV